ncbi:MAG: DNA polymerase III subunit delta [Candidatus Staskawiczbacteria bacterium]|nr:DNA polymerase III subunit delta [Candidatus Staskawiczbacteria bacterium]
MSENMIIFLYGPDSFRSKIKLNEIIEGYKKSKKSLLNLNYFDASNKEFKNFYDNFKVSSMFDEKKLVILKNVFSSKNFQEEFLENLKNLEALKDLIVIYEGDGVDERTKVFKTLKKECKSQEFELLDTKKIRAFAQVEFEKKGQKINNDALDLLTSYIGSDLWRLYQEINKLSAFKNGTTIKKEDVEIQVKPKIENDIFKTIDALASRNKKQALEFMKKHIDGGDSPLYLLSMIAYQFKNLLVIKELANKGLMYASIVKKSGLHPYVVKKNYFVCSQFSQEQLRGIYKSIFIIDSDIKSGRIEPEMALDLLISKI